MSRASCLRHPARTPTTGGGHFCHKTLRHPDTSAPQNWCLSLSRITGGAVSLRKCPGSKCPTGFSSITALVSKCLIVPRFWCRSVLRLVPKCPRVSLCRSVLYTTTPRPRERTAISRVAFESSIAFINR